MLIENLCRRINDVQQVECAASGSWTAGNDTESDGFDEDLFFVKYMGVPCTGTS